MKVRFLFYFLAFLVLCRLPFALFSRFFDSDDAMNGLMALSVLRGDIPLYYWGQGYLNSITPILAALFMSLVPDGRIAVKLVSLVLHAAGVWMLAYFVLRASGRRAAAAGVLVAAALLPLPLAGMSMGAGSPAARNLTILCGIACWTLFLNFPRIGAGFLAGILAGIAYWNEPPALLFLVPPGAWLLYRSVNAMPAREASAGLRWLGAAGAGFLLGAAPHLFGLAGGQAAIRPGLEWHLFFEAPQRLSGTIFGALPRLFGSGAGDGAGWLAGPAALLLLAFMAYRAHRTAFSRKMPGLRIPVAFADIFLVVFLFVYLLVPADPSGSGRYLVFLWPVAALWAGAGAAALNRKGLFAVLAAYCATMAGSLPGYGRISAAWDINIGPAIELLEKNRIKGGFANYWAANLITLKLRERVVVAQFTGVPLRHRRYYGLLGEMDRVGYLFNVDRFPEDAGMREGILKAVAAMNTGYESFKKEGWELVLPGKPLPIGAINELRLAPGREEIRRRLEELEKTQRNLRKTSRTWR